MKKYFTILILLLFPFIVISAKQGSVPTVLANKLKESIKFDGKLFESIYKKVSFGNFTQQDPSEGQPATEKTDVWVSYDESHLYISARLADSKPEAIDASLARRDSWIDSDWFFFYVDPYHDKKTGYFFAVNPAGSIIDGTYFNDSWNDDSWDGIWAAKTSIDEQGWNVEMKIPFTQLRFKDSEKMTWGINFQRKIKRNNEKSFLVMVPKNESGFVSHFAALDGLNGIKPKQRFELLPYIVQKVQYLRHDADDPFYKSSQYKTMIGADIKLGIGSSLNLDATINPDFGQVEVDPAVVNLSAFETYFPEKRPFFIEGSNIFMFGYGGSHSNWNFNFGVPSLFYSRRIGRAPQGDISDNDFENCPNETRILGAAKLTGKLDETWSVGALSSLTERTYASLHIEGERLKEEVEPLTHYGVFRTQKEFNDGKQALGMMFTSVNRNLQTSSLTEALAKEAYTFGLDGWTFLDNDETYVITGSFVGSYTKGSKDYLVNLQEEPYRYMQRPDAKYAKFDENRTSLTGWYSRFLFNKQKGNFHLNAALGAASPGFEYNDLGFQWFADRIEGHIGAGYSWYEPDMIFREKMILAAYFRDYDFEGNVLSNGIFSVGNLQFLNYYGIEVRSSYSFETLNRTLTRGGPIVKNTREFWSEFAGYSDTRKDIILRLNGSYWREEIGSYGSSMGFDVEWKPNSQINLSVGPSYSKTFQKRQWVDNIDDSMAVNTFNTRYIFGELNQKTISANIRLNWTFSPTVSLQLFFQPLFSVGKYNNYKELAKPRSLEFNMYDGITSTIEYDPENEEFNVDPDGSGPAETFSFEDPNFNFKSFRGNVVLRWEVFPGSAFFFVWSHDKVNEDYAGSFDFKRDFRSLMRSEANNIFLIKFSYWFDV